MTRFRGIRAFRSSFALVVLLLFAGDAPCAFIRSDFNGDGKIDITNSTHLLGYLFHGLDSGGCLDAGDFNDDGQVDIDDPIYCLKFLFYFGELAPRPPFPSCGEDPTADAIGCEAAQSCGGV